MDCIDSNCISNSNCNTISAMSIPKCDTSKGKCYCYLKNMCQGLKSFFLEIYKGYFLLNFLDSLKTPITPYSKINYWTSNNLLNTNGETNIN